MLDKAVWCAYRSLSRLLTNGVTQLIPQCGSFQCDRSYVLMRNLFNLSNAVDVLNEAAHIDPQKSKNEHIRVDTFTIEYRTTRLRGVRSEKCDLQWRRSHLKFKINLSVAVVGIVVESVWWQQDLDHEHLAKDLR